MKLTPDEERICRKYSEYVGGSVHCFECPLAVDKRDCTCKANVSEEEWREHQDESEADT